MQRIGWAFYRWAMNAKYRQQARARDGYKEAVGWAFYRWAMHTAACRKRQRED